MQQAVGIHFRSWKEASYQVQASRKITVQGTKQGDFTASYGVFAPWDLRNTTTKHRVSGRGNQRMPLAVPYIPSADLIRQGGRITDCGNIIVSRPAPFNFVKEAWFCVPKDNDRRGFELVEKIMDERLEDELVLDYQPSPILRDFKKDQDIMGLLCDMPTGPHNAEKERLLCALAASVDYHPDDTRPTSSHERGSRLHDQAHSSWRFLWWSWRQRSPLAPLSSLLLCNTVSIFEMHNVLVAIYFLWQVQKDRTCRSGSICGCPKYEHCADHGGGSSSSTFNRSRGR